jgi:hypothetical protein
MNATASILKPKERFEIAKIPGEEKENLSDSLDQDKRLNNLCNIYTREIVMKPNNYAMKDWHLEHVEKVIVRFVKGISPDASSFEKRNYKRYSTVSSCAKQIEYDIKHGVSTDEVMNVVRRIRHDKKFHDLQKNPESLQRLDELERQISVPKKLTSAWY